MRCCDPCGGMGSGFGVEGIIRFRPFRSPACKVHTPPPGPPTPLICHDLSRAMIAAHIISHPLDEPVLHQLRPGVLVLVGPGADEAPDVLLADQQPVVLHDVQRPAAVRTYNKTQLYKACGGPRGRAVSSSWKVGRGGGAASERGVGGGGGATGAAQKHLAFCRVPDVLRGPMPQHGRRTRVRMHASAALEARPTHRHRTRLRHTRARAQLPCFGLLGTDYGLSCCHPERHATPVASEVCAQACWHAPHRTAPHGMHLPWHTPTPTPYTCTHTLCAL